ncbi:unnamed protein product [Phaedon cochleariae]|uniref:Dystroglycan 1 n=1 Tax=Phaedon cochleariae TaxID=80249 RepID=A0A9N9SIS0_PHACE|nr:unnamed protein product [Phaedon cochleariae]
MRACHAAVLALPVVLVLLAPPSASAHRSPDDFDFDADDDLEVEFEGDGVFDGGDRGREATAYVGRAFRLAVPRAGVGVGERGFEAKRQPPGTALPPWLLFDRTDGIFWGAPLLRDSGNLRLSIKPAGATGEPYDVKITVAEELPDTAEKCPENEDVTVLTLLFDKQAEAIKPKQRVMAIHNVAKFFGLPYSAFTLEPQLAEDDINDSSVILAGPGNLASRISKATTTLKVAVGCDGRLRVATAPTVRQLKRQARDGTISEVAGLPLIGWRVKTETREVVGTNREKRDVKTSREKREVWVPADEDGDGSGDYDEEDEYYDDYENYDDDDLGAVEKVPPSPEIPVTLPPKKTTTTTSTTSTTTTTTTSTTTTTETPTHPHRHHHGENNLSLPVHHPTTHKDPHIPITFPPPTTPQQPPKLPPTTTTTPKPPPTPPKTPVKPGDVLSYEDPYDYDYDDEDDYGEGPVESETVVPEVTGKNKEQTFVPAFEDTESMTTEEITSETSKATYVASRPTTTSTTTTTTAAPTTTTMAATTTASTGRPTTTTTTGTGVSGTEASIAVEVTAEDEITTETERPTTIVPELTHPTETSTPATTTTVTTNTTPELLVPSPTTTTTTAATTTTTEVYTTKEETTPTTMRTTPPTTKPSTTTTTTTTTTTEQVEYHDNFDPIVLNRLKQMSVTAGKVFRFVIPPDTFSDFEDEYAMTYQILDANERTVTNNTWLTFNPTRREIYGLPLEEDISKWVFWVQATDGDGGSAKDKLNIQVQQHKLDLVVNHEFSLHIRIEKQQEFPHYVDWSLKVLRALGKIYNTNMSEITVRRINFTSELAIFTWSNDSISVPTNFCPKTDIEDLFKTLTANDMGDPSKELNMALAPELRVKKVTYREIGVCEQPMTPVTPPVNFSPILRNPIDTVNATVGELLVFKVRDDTFYDPEDVDPRMLNISLLTKDRQPLPSHNWLQFDNKNREFFGIPRKDGTTEYHLVCTDSGGLPVTDSLEVVVTPPDKKAYNVEFSMNVNIQSDEYITHEMFVNNAVLQKKMVDKLMLLFGEATPSNFHFPPFRKSEDSTIVTWFNKSLPVHRCPFEEIKRLESIVHNLNDRSISHRVHAIMEPEFRVSTIKVNLMGSCRPKKPKDSRPEEGVPIEETTPRSSNDEYLITFIVPAVIIAIMLVLAAVAAIIMYRRRRMGKMNVEEDGRQSYGNKGIPVIFQEELEEKPEPGTKAPVILKDEKPPLAPPEYSKSGSVKLSDDSEPYQPPPPFTRTQDNGRQPRPKPTPTYRKPPPYVPP